MFVFHEKTRYKMVFSRKKLYPPYWGHQFFWSWPPGFPVDFIMIPPGIFWKFIGKPNNLIIFKRNRYFFNFKYYFIFYLLSNCTIIVCFDFFYQFLLWLSPWEDWRKKVFNNLHFFYGKEAELCIKLETRKYTN